MIATIMLFMFKKYVMKIMYRKLVFTFMLLSMVTQLNAKGELMRSLVFPGWGELKWKKLKEQKCLWLQIYLSLQLIF